MRDGSFEAFSDFSGQKRSFKIIQTNIFHVSVYLHVDAQEKSY